jgi:hypothetical protein
MDECVDEIVKGLRFFGGGVGGGGLMHTREYTVVWCLVFSTN